MRRSAVQYEAMGFCVYLAGAFRSVGTVRISAAGQTLSACNFAMGMRPSAGRTCMYPTRCRWPQTRKRYKGRLQNGGWEGETRRQSTFVQACARFVGWCGISERYFAPREAAEGRVDASMFIPPGPHLARPHSYCVARERVGSVYAGDGDAIRQVQMLLT